MNQNLLLAGGHSFSDRKGTDDPLKDLPDLTVKARERIALKSEKARLSLRRAQRRCLIEDSFRLDSGGRCLDQDLATHASTAYGLTYFAAITDEYMRLRRSYQQRCKLLTRALEFVDAETVGCWKWLDFDDQMTFERACLPKVRNVLRDEKDRRLEEALDDQEASLERPTSTQQALVGGGRSAGVQTRKGFVNLTDQQMEILRLLVLKHETSGGAEFYFTQSHTGAGISYAGIQECIYCSEIDLYQLRSDRLVALLRVSSNVYRGKPTQLGITTIRRGLAPSETPVIQPMAANSGAWHNGRPSRFDVEKHAKEIFKAGLEDRIEEYEKKQARILHEASLTTNAGAYLPALIQWKRKRLQAEILVLADAWVQAGTTYGIPLGNWAYKALEKESALITAGICSALRGELDLHAARTRTTRSNTNASSEMDRAMKSVLNHARVKLETQRIKAECLLRSVAPSGLQGRPQAPKTYKTALARNIDKLRKECGWSFDDLAKATELDKKLALGHVNDGKGAHPKTLETYARTFTEKLGRSVTVAELES